MFTGIVHSMGAVVSVIRKAAGARLTVDAPALPRPIADGASISVNGTCLTVVSSDATRVEFDVVPETLTGTTLGALNAGDRINLEPSLRVGDRMDGHTVQGHIDGTACVSRITSDESGQMWTFRVDDPELMPYIVPKGSIAIDGVSLTIARVGKGNTFTIALIPTTLTVTTLGRLRIGDRVNIETDILARTVVNTLRNYLGVTNPGPIGDATPSVGGLTLEMLRENGW